jgi:hypothetical protein
MRPLTGPPLDPADSSAQPRSAPDLPLKDVFDIYQKQSDSQHKLWTYFQFVSLAVLGYTLGAEKAQWSSWTYFIVGFSFAFFAIANGWVIGRSQAELNSISEGLKIAAWGGGPVTNSITVRAVDLRLVVAFHVLASLVVLVAIGATWHDKCAGVQQCPRTEASK